MRFDHIPQALFAGVVGTAAMSGFASMAPMMGMPPMNPAAMLASQMGGSMVMGWMAHFMVGMILATVFSVVAKERLPGPLFIRGAMFAMAPWLMAQVVMMPMMGMGFFSGSAMMAGGSMVGHLVFGAVVGVVLDLSVTRTPLPA